jgi:S-DNA-T family DNA segregation ATPase FtsK/SpoIIIE
MADKGHQRMRTTRVAASKRTNGTKSSHRKADIWGICVIALGLVVAVALAMGNAGLLGQGVAEMFRALFGNGAWVAPPALVLMGIGLIFGRRSFEVTQLGIGLVLIFLAVVGFMARPLSGDYLDPNTVSQSGGYVGGLVAVAFSSMLGSAMNVGLGALALVGAVLCLQMPVRNIVESMSQQAAAIKEKAKSVSQPKTNSAKAVVQRTESPVSPAKTRILERTPSPYQPPLIDEDDEPAPTKRQPLIREMNERGGGAMVDSTPKEGYKLPPITILNAAPDKPKRSAQEMQQNIQTLESTLEEFGIEANVVEVATGPTITRYECQLGPGIRVNRITALADNIAMNLAASHVRVEAPIPGKAAIGVEVPNAKPSMVTIREVCDTREFRDHPSRLFVALGQDVSGQNRYADLTKMPHLLIGGATNSGKSIGLATLITSLLMRNTPKDLRIVMIDPKRVELTLFDRIPHLMCPVITDIKEAPGVLRAVWREMDRRYDVLSKERVRNIDGWNEKASFQEKMPYIVVVIDELADLMIAAKAEVETTIVRLAQLARAVGIHLVIATQRPSVDVITGTIKANIPSRVAFAVSSQIDSRTILDEKGAEDLIGRGDMLYMPIDAPKPMRIQGCYVSEKEIEAICEFWREQEPPSYILTPADYADGGPASEGRGTRSSGDEDNDPLWEEAVIFAAERGQVSTSMLQRRFSIGFQRASRMLDIMEERSIVGPRDGPRPREVLLNILEAEQMFGRSAPYPEDEVM